MCPSTRGRGRGGGSGGVPPRHVCCVQARDKICDPGPRGVLEGAVRGGFPPPARLLCPSTRPAAVSKHETGTVNNRCLRGAVRGGGSPAGTSAVSKHETKSVTQHQGACSKGRSGGVPPPSTAAVSEHETGCCVQARDRYCEQLVLEGGGPGGGSPPGTAAVYKHETGTVTEQTTDALQFMVAFALRGGGGGGLLHIREYISLRCVLESGRCVPEPARL